MENNSNISLSKAVEAIEQIDLETLESDVPQNVSREENRALRDLTGDSTIMIKPADKGRNLVIQDTWVRSNRRGSARTGSDSYKSFYGRPH